jgi:hypothetical protein
VYSRGLRVKREWKIEELNDVVADSSNWIKYSKILSYQF